jgi:hypothetical protein
VASTTAGSTFVVTAASGALVSDSSSLESPKTFTSSSEVANKVVLELIRGSEVKVLTDWKDGMRVGGFTVENEYPLGSKCRIVRINVRK